MSGNARNDGDFLEGIKESLLGLFGCDTSKHEHHDQQYPGGYPENPNPPAPRVNMFNNQEQMGHYAMAPRRHSLEASIAYYPRTNSVSGESLLRASSAASDTPRSSRQTAMFTKISPTNSAASGASPVSRASSAASVSRVSSSASASRLSSSGSRASNTASPAQSPHGTPLLFAAARGVGIPHGNSQKDSPKASNLTSQNNSKSKDSKSKSTDGPRQVKRTLKKVPDISVPTRSENRGVPYAEKYVGENEFARISSR